MESIRVVEVLHDRGELAHPRWLLGSGFVVKSGFVITAAHNIGSTASECGPVRSFVRTLDGIEWAGTCVARSDEIDLALLAVPEIKVSSVRLARVDRSRIDVVRDVMAVGFPNYKYADERPIAERRQPAQPVGSIPTIEDSSGGHLTLKIEAGEPAPPSPSGDSPWQGLSGAGVVVGSALVGVVIEHHLAEGLGALRIVPLTKLQELGGVERAHFCAILGIEDPEQLPIVGDPEEGDEVLKRIVGDLHDLITLSEQGLLSPVELSALKMKAVEKGKGW